MRIVVVGSDVDVGADVDTQTDGERLQAMCRPSIRPRSAITEARAGRRRLLEQGPHRSLEQGWLWPLEQGPEQEAAPVVWSGGREPRR